MRKQSGKMQQRWVDTYLNGGVFTEGYHRIPARVDRPWVGGCAACYDAMEWLAKAEPDITTLEEAWDRCPRPDWLWWAYLRLNPSKKDLKKLFEVHLTLLRDLEQNKQVMATMETIYPGFANRLVREKEIAEGRLQIIGTYWPKSEIASWFDDCYSTNSLSTLCSSPQYDCSGVGIDHNASRELTECMGALSNTIREHVPNPWKK